MFHLRNRLGKRPGRSLATRGAVAPRLRLECLEERTLLATVHFVVDPQQDAHAISRFIYGVNAALTGDLANLTFTRSGGNRWTAYNWENNASNAGNDYIFQNDGYLGGGNTPGGAVIPTLQNASDHNAGALITIPINGYVAADKNGDGDVRNSGADYLQTRFRQEQARKGSAFTLTPDTTDGVVYQDEFVNWVKTNFPYGQTDPNRPIWFSLDNEPDLWSSTHAEVHPSNPTYAEMVQKTIEYASAIKDVAPNTQIFGPVNYGWQGYIRLQDAPDANNRDFQAFYLQQLAQAEQTYGKRLLDVLDVHWYPEAQGGGIRITGQDTSAAVVAARLQAPRSLWDPTYTETSWITQWSTGGPIDLLDRLQGKIDANYPGTKLAVTEYNYGGGNHISGGIAQADVLGIFGREGVFAANQWALSDNEPFVTGAFQMYRNYDGNNGTFGDTSILASTDDVASSSVYASIDSANPGVITLVAINKTSQPLTSLLDLNGVQAGATASVYQLTSASTHPQPAGQYVITDPTAFSYTMPAYSVSTIRITAGSLPPPEGPTLSINDVTVTEGNTGTTNAVFTVRLSAASGQAVTVNYATADGTAGAADYVAKSGTLTFAPGETSKTITVAVKGDVLDELNETFTVNLSSPSNATVAKSQGVGTIADNDLPPSLRISDVTVTEGTGNTVNAVFVVKLSAISGAPVSVNYATADGTAGAADYTATSGTLSFAPGETSKTISVAITGDALHEANETLFVNLSSASNATIADAQGKCTIKDNDPRPSLAIADVTVTEGTGVTVNAVFTVGLSAASGLPVTVRYTTANGTARLSDYAARGGTLTFAPGETSKTVSVPITGDALKEANETLFVNLSYAANATIARARGVGTILDDDSSAAPSWHGGVTVTLADTDDWGTGFVGAMTIRNNTTSDINGWTLEFDLGVDITDLWDGEIVSRVGNRYKVSAAAWNGTIAAGGQVTFGFVANRIGASEVPANVVLNGVPV